VDIAKFFRSVKGTVNSAKATLEEEMKFSEMKQEALSYKDELLGASAELERLTDMTAINSEITGLKNDISLDTSLSTPSAPAAPKAPEVVTFTPKAKVIQPVETKSPEENA
jgi:sec-independent protein translocase protein TatB